MVQVTMSKDLQLFSYLKVGVGNDRGRAVWLESVGWAETSE